MPTYITLLQYTQQGFQKIKDGPTRLEAAKQSVRAMGGELKAFYLVMGQYELATVREADAEAGPTARLVEALQGIREREGETIAPADLLTALKARPGWEWVKSPRAAGRPREPVRDRPAAGGGKVLRISPLHGGKGFGKSARTEISHGV